LKNGHKTWVAVRTRFIDDRVADHAVGGGPPQLVNLGAGMDTRPYRLECYAAFTGGAFYVDVVEVNLPRSRIFGELLGAPPSHCAIKTIDLDFLDKKKTLATELGKADSGFDLAAPTLFICEGLIM
jgi:methyltransferase (TIGR00027 family)